MENLNYKICDQCDSKMLPETLEKTFSFQGKELKIKGIKGYRCEHCGEEVFDASELRMIDSLIQVMNDKPSVDILNLDETAEYLRVSGQTIYNMIRDGRIKAYKVGREWRFLRSDILTYLESNSTDRLLSLAAKGGDIDDHDLDIIKEEIEKRKNSDG